MRAQIDWNPHDGKFWCIEIVHAGGRIRCGLERFKELMEKLRILEKELEKEGIS